MTTLMKKNNPGLARRFPLDSAFLVEVYTQVELLDVLKKEIVNKGRIYSKRLLNRIILIFFLLLPILIV